MDKDLEDDPRVDELAERMAATSGIGKRIARNAVIGGLYHLWRYGDTHLGRHNRLKGALRGPALIEDVTGLPASLIECFPHEWLRFHPDGSIELPDYAAKNSLIDRDIRREKGRERVRRWRERQRQKAEASNTSQGVTCTALQRHEGVTTGTGTGTGTGTETTETGTGTPTQRAALAAGVDAAAPRGSFDQDFRERFGFEPVAGASLAPRAVRTHNGAGKSPEQLEHDIDRLADSGMAPDEIAHALCQYGVTTSQVTTRLSRRPVDEGGFREGQQ